MEPTKLWASIDINRVLTAAGVVTLAVLLAVPAITWVLVITGVLPPNFCAR